MIGLWGSFEVAVTHYLLRHDPDLLAERLKLVPLAEEQKAWDKVVIFCFNAVCCNSSNCFSCTVAVIPNVSPAGSSTISRPTRL